jgi:hypothetical protein
VTHSRTLECGLHYWNYLIWVDRYFGNKRYRVTRSGVAERTGAELTEEFECVKRKLDAGNFDCWSGGSRVEHHNTKYRPLCVDTVDPIYLIEPRE